MYKGLVIYGTMHTGSNYLVSLLNQFEGIVCHGEVFNPAFVGLREDYHQKLGIMRSDTAVRDAALPRFYDRILESSPGDLVGIKLFPGHKEFAITKTLADPEILKIVLKRDSLASFVSLCQAEASGVWQIATPEPGEIKLQRLKSNRKIHFHPQRYLEYRRQLAAFYSRIEAYLRESAIPHMELWYRDLQEPDIVKKLAAFLGMPEPELNPEMLLRKQNPGSLESRVTNPETLRNFSAGMKQGGGVALKDIDAATAIIGNVVLPLDSPIISHNIRERVTSGKYELFEAKCTVDVIQENEVVLELGGGIGFISSVAWKTGKCKSITVVEANPEAIPVIEMTHRLNGVEADVIHGIALPSAGPGATRKFYIRNDFWASSSNPIPPDLSGLKYETEVPEVDVARLIATLRPTFIICDIEGDEDNLFANLDLTGVHKVLVELHQHVIGKAGMKRFFEEMARKNFHYDQWHARGGIVLFSHINNTALPGPPVPSLSDG
jgi:LPS sulfotransferase NodH